MDIDKADPRMDDAEKYYRKMLNSLGIDGDDKTARRYVQALSDMCSGGTPDVHLSVKFPPVQKEPSLICVSSIGFTSLCEHHLLPFWGTMSVGYVPAKGAMIVGLSKLARAVGELARRPQLQERLGEQVADAIERNLETIGVGVQILGTHTCMALRGVSTGCQTMMHTIVRRGVVSEHPFSEDFDRFAELYPFSPYTSE